MKSNTMFHGIIGKLLLIIMSPVLLTSCLWRSPVEVVISDKKIILTEKPFIFKCTPPFYRSRDGAWLKFMFSRKWNIYRPISGEGRDKGGIEFANGKVAFLKVSLIDDAGKCYVNDNATLSGDVAFGFALPTNVKIVKVEVTSSTEIECHKIYWYCSDQI